MNRIIAGSAKGQRLKVPIKGTRPTSEKVREAIFNILEHENAISHAHVIDIYAGSGALALEALSRGADNAYCVEHHPNTANIILTNATNIGFQEQLTVITDTVERFLTPPAPYIPYLPFHLVFLDPPYAITTDRLNSQLQQLANSHLLLEDAVIVVERDKRSPALTWPNNWNAISHRTWGETTVYFAEVITAV